MDAFDLLITDISDAVTVDPGSAESDDSGDGLGIIRSAAIGIREGKIAFVGPQAKLTPDVQSAAKRRFPARGAVVLPGLIDSHTHPVFSGSREDEFASRIAGISYMQIAEQGGGIKRTVRETRAATELELHIRARAWLDEMLSCGVTTIEAKSGYGLDIETELKQLRVLGKLDETHPIDVLASFMGAHEFPEGYESNREAYVEFVIEEALPSVAEQGIARFCDVFCETGVFSVDQSRRILTTAADLGLGLRLHADEFVESGGALLAAELGALSADHLTATGEAGMQAMAKEGVIATLLPGVSFYLGSAHYAKASRFIEHGVRVALASDFNPGSSVNCNLPLIACIAATQMKMQFHEIIAAITHHPASSLMLENRVGQLKIGMQADLLLLDIPRPEYFIYHVGRNHTWRVLKNGEWVYENPRSPIFLQR